MSDTVSALIRIEVYRADEIELLTSWLVTLNVRDMQGHCLRIRLPGADWNRGRGVDAFGHRSPAVGRTGEPGERKAPTGVGHNCTAHPRSLGHLTGLKSISAFREEFYEHVSSI